VDLTHLHCDPRVIFFFFLYIKKKEVTVGDLPWLVISAIQAAGAMSPSFSNLLALLVLGSKIYVVCCHWNIFIYMSQTCVLSIGSLTSISILRK
jgi:hypothetical protein